MRFLEALCETLVRALGLSTFTGWESSLTNQQPLVGDVQHDVELPKGPKFQLPNAKITCDYSAMKGYKFVGGSQTGPVGSWLEPPDDKDPVYNIFTNYEDATSQGTPQGITRVVCLSCTTFDKLYGLLADSTIS